jgi:hypothetical protein
MANRHAAFKDVMSELRGKIKEHSASKYKSHEPDDDSEVEGDHEEPDGDEDEDADEMSEEEPEGPDLCSNCDSKMDVKHKFCANCGTKK